MPNHKDSVYHRFGPNDILHTVVHAQPLVTLTSGSSGYSGNQSFPAGPTVMSPVTKTNVNPRSEQLDLYNFIGAFAIGDTTLSPIGNKTADKLAEQAVTSAHQWYRLTATSIAVGDLYTASTFLKAGERTQMFFGCGGAAFVGDHGAYFDLANGTYSNADASLVDVGMKDAGNGWWRCWASMRVVASGAVAGNVGYLMSGGLLSYAGTSGSGAYVWGTQFESGSLSDYIPTAATNVSRTYSPLDATGGVTFPSGSMSLYEGVRSRRDVFPGNGQNSGLEIYPIDQMPTHSIDKVLFISGSYPATGSARFVKARTSAAPNRQAITSEDWYQEHWSPIENLYEYYSRMNPEYFTGSYDYYSLFFYPAAAYRSSAVLFSGSSLPTMTSSFTVQAWIKPTAITGTQDYTIMAQRGRWKFFITGSTGKLAFADDQTTIYSSGSLLTPGRWQHVAFTYSSSSAGCFPEFYVNFAAVGDQISYTRKLTGSVSSSLFSVGAEYVFVDGVLAPDRGFKGFIFETQVWDIKRSAAELSSSVSVQTGTLSSHLLHYGKFNDGPLGSAHVFAVGSGALDSASGVSGQFANFDSSTATVAGDSSVTDHGFGVGNASTTAYQLQRTLTGSVYDSYGGPWLAPSKPRTNLLIRSTFSSSWSTDGTTTLSGAQGTAPDGTSTATKFIESSALGSHYAYQAWTSYVPNSIYTYSQFAKAGSAGRNIALTVNMGGTVVGTVFNLTTGATIGNVGSGTPISTSASFIGDGWWRFQISVRAIPFIGSPIVGPFITQSTTSLSYTGDGSSYVWVWGAQLERALSASKYIPTAASTVTVVPSYYPGAGDGFAAVTDVRAPAAQVYIDGDGLGTRLLSQQSRSNLCLQSQTFDNATWSKARCTIVANTTTAPDGTVTADSMVEDTNTNIHEPFQLVSGLRANATYTLSVYAKPSARTRCFLATDTALQAIYDLSTGTIVSGPGGTAISASITPAPNGWWRCSLTWVNDSRTADDMYIGSVSGSSLSYLGTAVTASHFWGAQVEEGTIAGDYIPTTTVSASRTDYTLTTAGALTMGVAPRTGSYLSWTGDYYWPKSFHVPLWQPNDNVTFVTNKTKVNGSCGTFKVLHLPSLFYGRQISTGSLYLTCNAYDNLGISRVLVDDGRGSLYISGSMTRAIGQEDTTGVKWRKVGNVFYSEGLVVITDPSLVDFGEYPAGNWSGVNEPFAASFRGEQRVNTQTIMCRLGATEGNASLNPTYSRIDSTGRTVLRRETPVTYVTAVGIYNEDRQLVAVAKIAQPIRKREKDAWDIRLKMDY